jgi:flavin reductase (DIM6/NTAB) family NADH-FMN oxidoreductase RutF
MDARSYRDAIAHFATGVTVVTTVARGRVAGMTASAVASVSLEPILLLVCISNRLPTHEAIEESGRFAVNVLGEGQGALARRFATPSADKFSGVLLEAEFDLPVLTGSVAYFICDVRERFPGGDHSIFIGDVKDCAAIPGRKPLLYFRSGFGKIDDPEAYMAREVAAWDLGM